ncbi:MAG: transcriptional regulator [Planctomycetaceae bacterium]|nr:transcriptional regulator [Planctomycetaceae bacterium]|tara:strand:+ start:5893 stop:7044 length:1152 start_codon:yes stop_codon:yes gene_type:complete
MNMNRPVPLLDVPRGNAPLREEFLEALANVLDSGRFLFGPDVKQLEEECARWSNTRFGIGCASGSDALLLSLMAMGLREGDEVICPSFTFFATASAISRLGGVPVFVDIDPVTFNIDPVKLAEAVTDKTKAVIPVHLFGQCADMDTIMEICDEHGLVVIEDAAQSIGANINGRPAGAWGHFGCISFYPTKNLGGMGDGGMIVTNDEELEDRLRLYSGHGMRPRYYHKVIGINSRLDSMQAAVLNVKIKHLDDAVTGRQKNAELYQELLQASGLANEISLPVSVYGDGHVWNQYTIRVHHGKRDELKAFLGERNIGSEIYYPVPLHMQHCFRTLGYQPEDLPETLRASREVLSLPIFPELEEEEVRIVVDGVQQFFAMSQRRAA